MKDLLPRMLQFDDDKRLRWKELTDHDLLKEKPAKIKIVQAGANNQKITT
jgi:hypothetical protein